MQALDTVHKLRDIKGYVRLTLDKLPGIRADLVGLDDEWHEWDFPKLVESLRKWTDRNPKTICNSEKHKKYKRENVFKIKEQESKNRQSNPETRACIYCEKSEHKASECESVSSTVESRLILARKKLSFNSTGGQHRASECRSNRTCFSCKGKHHTSVCDKKGNVLLTINSNTVTYPVIIVSVEGVKCRALIDTGAGASYVSSKFISLINKKPAQTETKTIQTLLNTSSKKMPIYSVQISDTKHQFSFQTELHKLEKSVLVELPNPKYLELQNKYQHLKDLEINHSDPKAVLPVHILLDVNN